MVAVVGTILAFLASSLSEKIKENERLEKQQNILYAMGINQNEGEGSVNFIPTDAVAGEFSKYIKEQLIIEGDKITKDDQAYLIDLKKQATAAKNGETRKLPLFIGEKDGKNSISFP